MALRPALALTERASLRASAIVKIRLSKKGDLKAPGRRRERMPGFRKSKREAMQKPYKAAVSMFLTTDALRSGALTIRWRERRPPASAGAVTPAVAVEA
jgi:hypothetical protein